LLEATGKVAVQKIRDACRQYNPKSRDRMMFSNDGKQKKG
jgi:hypothetical protein